MMYLHIEEIVCCLSFALCVFCSLFYFVASRESRVSTCEMCTRNLGNSMSLGRIYKTHLRPSCTQSGCAIKSSVYSLPARDRLFFYYRSRWGHSLTYCPKPNRKIWYHKIFIRSRLRSRILPWFAPHQKKAIALRTTVGEKARQKIMTKEREGERKKQCKKNHRKCNEASLHEYSVNILCK